MSGRRRRGHEAGKGRGRQFEQRDVRSHSALCSHDRILYPSAAAARTAACAKRKNDRSAAHLRPYPCSDVEGQFHLGLLPRAVVAGEVDVDTYYRGEAPLSCYPGGIPVTLAAGNLEPPR